MINYSSNNTAIILVCISPLIVINFSPEIMFSVFGGDSNAKLDEKYLNGN